MQRSQINRIMTEARETIRGFGFGLPPFADWSTETFRARRQEARHIIRCRPGWDITDFGGGSRR